MTYPATSQTWTTEMLFYLLHCCYCVVWPSNHMGKQLQESASKIRTFCKTLAVKQCYTCIRLLSVSRSQFSNTRIHWLKEVAVMSFNIVYCHENFEGKVSAETYSSDDFMFCGHILPHPERLCYLIWDQYKDCLIFHRDLCRVGFKAFERG